MTVCCARLSAPSSAAVTTRYRISLTHNFPLHSKIFYTLNSLTRSKCSQAVVKSETTRNRNFAISPNSSVAVPSDDFVVVNFYRFVFIENPHDEVAKHLSFLKVFTSFHFLTAFFSHCSYNVNLDFALDILYIIFKFLIIFTNVQFF